jgi:hypothetical protein
LRLLSLDPGRVAAPHYRGALVFSHRVVFRSPALCPPAAPSPAPQPFRPE